MCIVKSCCCLDLRTGGLIIGCIGVVGSSLLLLIYTIQGLIAAVAGLSVNYALMYGIKAKKPIWMMFSILVSTIGFVVCSIIGIIGLFTSSSKFDGNPANIEDHTLLVIVIFCYAIGLGLFVYFTSVLFSLFKQMENDKLNPFVV